jgi:mevalonate kinase
MERKELIDKILNLSGDEFETKEDYIKLAKETTDELVKRLIYINQQLLNN